MNCENPDCDQSLPDHFGSYGCSGRKRKYCNARCRAAAYRRKRGIERKITRQITVHADELVEILLTADANRNLLAKRQLFALMPQNYAQPPTPQPEPLIKGVHYLAWRSRS